MLVRLLSGVRWGLYARQTVPCHCLLVRWAWEGAGGNGISDGLEESGIANFCTQGYMRHPSSSLGSNTVRVMIVALVSNAHLFLFLLTSLFLVRLPNLRRGVIRIGDKELRF